ncbi:MAG: bifunctional glycogen debranching protein GlgX/4-alpha-glucanotransferase, partial [Peptostreptococcales bacterium]
KPKGLIHGHWNDTPFYIRDKKGGIKRWTFFGGNLKGIIKKLPYLEELGATILYLNPIFEAASNHKYDTGDYHKVDPMYGDMETFVTLVQEARKIGISIILDGVFSHTGSDSRYFNKYGNYPELGAYQSEKSPYYSWYKWKEPGKTYESWWGVEDLPNVNELNPSFQDFIFGSENSVIQFWLRKGIKGWRLDVADELPVEFIRKLRQAIHKVDSEAILIGEVWEDASNKSSYGEMRQYFSGEKLDSTMNYPLRKILLSYLLEKIDGREAVNRMMNLYENYPLENVRAAMNIIGSHDRIRILTILGDAPHEASLTQQEREDYRLTDEARKKAIERLKLLALMQITLPGVPCIYYGDEVGLEGYSDPYNRGTFPWGHEDKVLQHWYKRIIRLYKEYEVFLNGQFSPFNMDKDLLGFRSTGDGEEMIVCVNRNCCESVEAVLRLDDFMRFKEGEKTDENNLLILELLSDGKMEPKFLEVSDQCFLPTVDLKLKPLEGKVFYIGQKPKPCPAYEERTAGILFHITSLPSRWGIGDMGKEAEDFIDFLADTGQRYWQVLPLNPLGEGYSPYQSPSVMAGNTLLINIERLQEEGLLMEKELQKSLKYLEQVRSNQSKADYALASEVKEPLLRQAWGAFKDYLKQNKYSSNKESGDQRAYLSNENYEKFLKQNRSWLEDYSLYQAIKKQFHGKPWVEWDYPIAFRDEKTLESLRDEFKEEIDYQCFLQYTFFFQWRIIKEYGEKKGINMIGDLSIYVAADSCDTWTNKQLFKLDSEGRPTAVAGVPPDYFSKTGQHWGNPIFNWTEMEKENYAWWKARVKQVLDQFDFIRLDHFRGFEAFWEIPAGAKNACYGRWLKGPGKRFFESLKQEFSTLPFIAEDLGFLTPEVDNLRNILGFPGIKVYQFEKDSDLENIVYYSGTHDNDTLLGWYRQLENKNLSDMKGPMWVKEVLENIYNSRASWVIIPLQDILGLDSTARMNNPGTVGGNWEWRMEKDALTEDVRKYLRELMIRTDRISPYNDKRK